MKEIEIKKPSEQELQAINVRSWPIWQKEVSRFDWSYSQKEVCYILEGLAKVETPNGNVEFSEGDMVTFPSGLDCVWEIKKPIKKHYKLG